MTDFTIAIPTYNGALRLPSLLERLQEQVNTETIAWEILVIDNNSTDGTEQVVRDYQTRWTKQFPLRYSCEKEQGLAYARQRAMTEARGTWVGFIDDDLCPALDWVYCACEFGQEYPSAGAYGGQVHGDFEVQPPENFQRIASFLAIRERGTNPHLYKPESLCLPPGAGLVVRKQAWLDSVPDRLAFGGRVGNSLLANEDFEALLYLHQAGWEIWYCPTLHSYHSIPSSRLTRDYLLRLMRDTGRGVCGLRLVGATSLERLAIILKLGFGSLRRIVLHVLKYRGQIATDLVAACELRYYLNTMLSPFYWFQQQRGNVRVNLQNNLAVSKEEAIAKAKIVG
ncbi:hormogonium polysaccharide biosynthesis glycosyltransferase HpsE [Oscillatoria sp. FACHB-1406]|uniref:hormogonium polysaccharide biosynthesis glycosyltransferase HpsE n=1 Tax=Oscillatoria sp. FACHB-1406 TaxID=2692846 RepID=UPI0016862B3A|nr:hormogonium polysaccharide biosynthesis glycosyltransferase HpsE [Oscillatoria sp. FACHB-1406]MBD2577592.1 glycosyltransferase family 2 protein [Oscillatoria sp. FACHB-1406]